jgi:hypothetical protein
VKKFIFWYSEINISGIEPIIKNLYFSKINYLNINLPLNLFSIQNFYLKDLILKFHLQFTLNTFSIYFSPKFIKKLFLC